MLLDKIMSRIDSWTSKYLLFLLGGFSFCLLFFIVFKFYGLEFSFFQSRLLRLLSRNSIGFYRMGKMCVFLRKKALGVV
jgi:hypothetical protein